MILNHPGFEDHPLGEAEGKAREKNETEINEFVKEHNRKRDEARQASEKR